MRFFSFFFLFLILLSASVLAIGVSPPKLYITYDEGAVEDFEFLVVNTGSSTTVSSFTKGVLAEYVTVHEDQFDFAGEKFHTVKASFRHPAFEELTEDQYGKQRFYVGFVDAPPENAGTVVARASIKAWVEVDIPFPGKYARIEKFEIPHVVEGEDAELSVEIFNRGTNDLSGTKVVISIINYAGEPMETLSYNNIFIRTDQRYTLDDIIDNIEQIQLQSCVKQVVISSIGEQGVNGYIWLGDYVISEQKAYAWICANKNNQHTYILQKEFEGLKKLNRYLCQGATVKFVSCRSEAKYTRAFLESVFAGKKLVLYERQVGWFLGIPISKPFWVD